MFEDNRYSLVRIYKLNVQKLQKYLLAIESLYRASNPYHNRLHAAFVLQAAHYMMIAGFKQNYMSDMDTLALIIAAVAHDVGHTGVSNMFLINSNSDLALRYNDKVTFHLCFPKVITIFICL